jgi:hypothetical protein
MWVFLPLEWANWMEEMLLPPANGWVLSKSNQRARLSLQFLVQSLDLLHQDPGDLLVPGMGQLWE